jgi:type I restriction enzyme S subunit
MSKWENILLDKLCNFEKGNTGLAKAIEGIYPLITTSSERKTCNTYQFDTKAVCIPLVSSTGHGHASINNIHYQEGKFALGTILVALIPKDENILNSKFLHLYLSRLKDIILVPLMTGAANVSLSVSKIKNVKIPLPPINEQIKIVKKFESIVDEQKELDFEIENQKTLLTKLKQSILQEAIEGKLTANWREENQDIETASVLLEKIQTEKEQLIKEKKIKKSKPLAKISEEEIPFEIPESWEWCRFQNIVDFSLGKTPPSKDISYWNNANYNWVSISDMTDYGIVNDTQRKVNEKSKNEVFKYPSIKQGTLLMSFKLTVGRTSILNTDAYHNEAIISITPFDGINKMYLFYLLPLLTSLTDKRSAIKGNTLNKDKLLKMKIALPPSNEQIEIVNKIEKLFAICAELEEQINSSKQNTQTLMQAVLKEAFER